MILFAIAFQLILVLFLRKHKDIVNDPVGRAVEMQLEEEQLLKDSQNSLSEISIIVRIFDVLMGLFYQLYMIIQLLGFIIIQLQMTYDSRSKERSQIFTIPLYNVFFCMGDSLGKFVPQKMFIKNIKLIHFINFNFLVIYAIFIFMLEVDVGEKWSSPYLRMALSCYAGFLNGY